MQDISLIDFSNIYNTNDIANITNDLQNQILSSLGAINTILSYFSGNGTKIIYNNGTSDYLKNLSIQDNTIDESKIINLTTDLGNKQPLADILTKLSALTYTDTYYLQSTSTGVQWSQILFSYLFSNFVTDTLPYTKITNADNSDYSILTKKGFMSANYPYFGTTSYMFCNTTFLGSSTTTNFNYYLISPSNLFTMIIETPQNANFKFLVNSQTTSNYLARIFFDQLATTTYLDFDQNLNAINITGTLRNNNSSLSASQNYEYITKYFSDLTYQPKSNILTALNSWGINNYILSTNGVNTITWVTSTSTIGDNTLSYKKLIWQTQPSTINQYQFISYDYTNDKLTSSQYINSSTMIADGTIAGAKITNETISYSKLLTYNNPSDLQFLKYNLTQDKLEYTTLTGSLFSDNTIPYNKLGTKTNNYAFITTDSTHANIVETVIDTSTKFNNYFASAIIDYTRLKAVNDTFTITSAYNNAFNINFNNTYSTTDNYVYHNINISNSSYGTRSFVWKYNSPYASYMTLDLLIDGANNYFSCTGNTSGIYNGSSYSKGVIISQWLKASSVISNNTSTSISSFAPYECLTKGVCEARYAIAGSPSTFGYNTNFVLRSEGYYFRTYVGSYSDHTYFMSSNSTSSPGIGTSYTWAALICGGGSSNYILEGRNYSSQSSTMCYINSGGYFYTGSQKKNKNNIKKYNDIDDDNDFNVFNIIKNIDISIFDYSNKEKKIDETEHENFTKGLIKEDIRETGIIIEDLEDQIKNNKNKKNTSDILQSFITYDHRLCEKNNDMLNCSTNTGNFCQKFISYNSIYNLNVHATKKLIKKVEKQHDIITDLQTRLTKLEDLMNTLTNKA